MGVTIVLGLTVLCATTYSGAFDFSGFDQFGKALHAPITNQPGQHFKSVAVPNQLKNVAAKFNGPSFDQFRQPFQHFQHGGPFGSNVQQFGPYPGYPGPVVYPGHGGGYPGPAPYPQASYRFGGADQTPLGFHPFPAPVQAQSGFGPAKVGAKKTYKTVPGAAANFPLPGKYFQEHNVNAYHGPEFSSATVPFDHNLKNSKPKDAAVFGQPIIPTETIFKNFNFPSPGAFGYSQFGFPQYQPYPQIQSFPQAPTFGKAEPALGSSTIKSQGIDERFRAPVTPTTVQGGSATSRSTEVTNQQPSVASSTLPTADDTLKSEQANSSPSQEEANAGTTSTAASEVSDNNEAPAADDTTGQQPNQEQSVVATGEGVNEPNAGNEGAVNGQGLQVQENASQEPKEFTPVIVEQVGDSSSGSTDENSNESTAVVGDSAPSAPTETATVEKSEEIIGDKPAEPADKQPVLVNGALPAALQNGLVAPVVSVSDPSAASLFGQPGFAAFAQNLDLQQQQPLYLPYYDPVSFAGAGLSAFNNLGGNIQQESVAISNNGAQVKGVQNGEAPASDNTVTTESSSSSTTSISSSSNSASLSSTVSSTTSDDGPEKKDTSQSGARNEPPVEAPKKSNTVQIIQDGSSFSGLPTLYDPSSSLPLDSSKFFNHPSITAYSGQAALDTYSPETAFTDFGSLFRQGYLIEGSPSLLPTDNVPSIQTIKSVTPVSIASKDHPFHGQVFKYTNAHVPYPGLVEPKINPQGLKTYDFASQVASVESSSPSVTSADTVSTTTSTTETASVSAKA
ncbi:platelet binding protein GspB-like [Adelges cooleyi]|uniref:platelet binding protein GspB-like n=1 Tax=Adelges cooleyi TaxID=133065 RepID=UPI0021801FAB|nr:platelet binding protein GspB-like [Adelges cooleyi]